jgi:Tol biopolymer transport system component/pimeloyl-ACP methyl ester carboxylesterase
VTTIVSPALEALKYGVRRYLSIKSSSSPQFASDDRSLAFLSDLTGVPQVWMVSLDEGAWPQQLTLGQERVGFLSYARKTDSIAYGVDAGGDERFQINLLHGGGEKLTKLTKELSVIHNWGDWSPDEKSVCFSSNARNQSFFDIYTQSLAAERPELVYQHDGNNYAAGWSPDASSILFSRIHSPFNHDLFLLSLGDGSVRPLTSHDGEAGYYSPSFDSTGRFVYCITDEGREYPGLARIDVATGALSYLYTEPWELEGLSLAPDGSKLAFTVNEDGYSRLMVWRTGESTPYRVETPRSVIGGLTWSNRSDRLAFTLSSSTTNSDVWLLDAPSGEVKRLTRSSTCGIPEGSFIQERLIKYPSFDGLEVPAFLYKPTDDGPRPLLLYLHGGPESQFRPGFSPLIQFLLQLGFSVVAPNFRGSTGYGRAYTHLDDVRKRMDTVKDSVAAVAEAQRQIAVDPARVVAWGGSYGGFMVLACLYSYPDLWAAGVDIVGISNFVTFLRNTGPWRRKLRIAEYGDPEKDGEFLESISPNNNAHLIKAPLFIIHGRNDPRVPMGEAGQIMQTMQKLEREAHLLAFDDEGHGLVKLQNRIEGYTAALGFVMYNITVERRGPSSSPQQA